MSASASSGTGTAGTELAVVLHAARDIRVQQLSRAELGPDQVRVALEATGLCGSDLHYYADMRNGPNVVTAPLVLGHEGAGRVVEVGPGVAPELVGQRVAIEPAMVCGRCPMCRAGRYNLCLHGTCLGSPPTHGTLRQSVVMPRANVHPVRRLDAGTAALVEPLAVGTWAVRRARLGLGDRVLITGAGPIGQLAAAAARLAGVSWIGMVDTAPARLASADGLADEYFDSVPTDGGAGGGVDALLECSGAPEVLADLGALRAGARIALVGIPARRPVPEGFLIMAQRYEYDVLGCFRYGPGAFHAAAELADSGRLDLRRLITASYPLAEAGTALHTALTDRSQLKTLVLSAP
ncbi:MAG TPA: alcohol dehydrogenase catalytic domain-containing protein [Pseudonocardia sp.]|uniref:alcohol dehydrogenase catalytic domain-containing protein n=1 Tax=Pseudonocardia sp. TaxID=60912 RepID=UPI002D13538C|nr:alcohol dehydrogenase catalytic domain-containing protein [Pseudonocardia sp.]HTF47960.1 alcohol dehydrogenase catalytic domain-containing protein [Pseudonocardia sp.]